MVARDHDRARGVGEHVLAGDHPHAAQDHGDVGLKRGHLAPAPSGRLARAVGGEVICRELVEVTQAPVGEHAGQTVALKPQSLVPPPMEASA